MQEYANVAKKWLLCSSNTLMTTMYKLLFCRNDSKLKIWEWFHPAALFGATCFTADLLSLLGPEKATCCPQNLDPRWGEKRSEEMHPNLNTEATETLCPDKKMYKLKPLS